MHVMSKKRPSLILPGDVETQPRKLARAGPPGCSTGAGTAGTAGATHAALDAAADAPWIAEDSSWSRPHQITIESVSGTWNIVGWHWESIGSSDSARMMAANDSAGAQWVQWELWQHSAGSSGTQGLSMRQ